MEVIVLEKPAAKLRRFGHWVARRYRLRYVRESFVTRFASGGAIVAGMIAMGIAALGMPTGLGVWADLLMLIGANLLLMLIAVYIAAILLSLLYVPLPRGLTAAFLYVGGQVAVTLRFMELDLLLSIGLGALYSAVAIGAGLALALLWRRNWGRGKVWLAVIGAAVIASVYLTAGLQVQPAALPVREPSTVASHEPLPVQGVEAEDPSLPGDYSFQTFTYGSGTDHRREQFGEGTDEVTSPVDGSKYIQDWPKLKRLFWGFDQTAMPINGTVWMPEGEGPFPLTLIVHGNHLMENFSDGGYAYLGELLASRGFIAVSVDANFLNFSVWSGIPDDDMKMRAWLLLKHLQQIQTLDQSGKSVFSGKISWDQTALIGHSRGGQAAAMAADAKGWFHDDKTLDSLQEVSIESVISIAPTDKKVDDKAARLRNVNYLTIQGAMDADVNTFYGDRQYNRTEFDSGTEQFKASLYIANANHSQFNTDWGSMDESLPGGFLLNREGLLAAEEQRQIAKVYVSAFLEATLHGKAEYKALFQNYRSGLQWLPETRYQSRYMDANMKPIAKFETYDGMIKNTKTDKMKLAGKEEAMDRDGIEKGTSGMALQWESRDASFEIELAERAADSLGDWDEGSLVFSLTNLELELTADKAGVLLPPLPQIEVAITASSGERRLAKLEDFIPAAEPAYTSFLSAGFLEHRISDNKFKNPVEAVYQTYIIPIESMRPDEAANQNELAGDGDAISRIEFRFLTGRGKVMIDDIGILPKEGTHVDYK
ncbi:alpha/beta hydrolase [Paenibacillus sp. GCM10027627]|uniref:poly(ethylene terephthalate) hydrolase family protein n=1 Tax=unclassified Paenibacillus TaxID=185978 RepID=UPI00363ED31C